MAAGQLVAMNPADKYTRGKVYWMGVRGALDGYVGSTVQPTLARRKASHVADSRHDHRKHRKALAHFAAVGWENVEITLLEAYPCDSRDQLRAREAYWCEQLRPTLNMIRPRRTLEQTKEYERVYNASRYVESRRRLARKVACKHCMKPLTYGNMARHVQSHCRASSTSCVGTPPST